MENKPNMLCFHSEKVKNRGKIKMENEEVYKQKINSMFQFNSKIYKKVPNELINNYKELLLMLINMQKNKELEVHPQNQYLGGNDLATNIYKKKYFLKDIDAELIETRPEQSFARIAAFVAAVEPDKQKQKQYAIRFYNALYKGHFIPGGRVIAGAGDLFRVKTLSNCFVTLIGNDSIEGIFDAAKECARTYSYGGGIGVDISNLRPRDSIVHNAADRSTGAVSFMQLYSMTTGLIGQSGRRGALMITLDVKHPDVYHFMDVKKEDDWVTKHIADQCEWSGAFDKSQIDLIRQKVRENTQVRFANISLKVTDEFMKAVEEQKEYNNKILIYDKKANTEEKIEYGHYSYEIPNKNIEDYELLQTFDNIEQLNQYLASNNVQAISKQELDSEEKRDKYGDYIVNARDKTLAIKYSGDYMLYFKSEQTGEIKNLVKAKSIWDKFVAGNYKTAEPGLIFWSTMTKYSPSNYIGKPIASTNPCGEVPLEDGGACNLTSLNLSRVVKNSFDENSEVDWNLVKDTIRLIVRFLDNVISWNEYLNPLEKQKQAAKNTRRIGLGYMGIADMLNQLGIGYDSDQGIKTMDILAKTISNTAYDESANLATEKGKSPVWDYDQYKKGAYFKERLSEETKQKIADKGLRNIAILSIAPTGTISNIVLSYKNTDKNYIGVSSGIEPIFGLFYTRRTETVGQSFYKVFHSTVQAYIDQKGLNEQCQEAEKEEELKGILPEHFFRTAHHISPEKRVTVQGTCQKYIDHSISSTCNLPEDVEPEVISDVYLKAWKAGLKGVTIYRDGSRFAILTVKSKENEFQKHKNSIVNVCLEGGESAELRGSSLIHDNQGRLTTVYHATKNNIPITSCRLDGTSILKISEGALELKKDKEEIEQQNKITENTEEIFDSNLKKCPVCEKVTLKVESGCSSCINPECGFSKCDH